MMKKNDNKKKDEQGWAMNDQLEKYSLSKLE
jgi:hypothetical protein